MGDKIKHTFIPFHDNPDAGSDAFVYEFCGNEVSLPWCLNKEAFGEEVEDVMEVKVGCGCICG